MSSPDAPVEILERTRSASWEERARAAEHLGRHLDDPRVWTRLEELLDDENTAVVDVATRQLVLHGGVRGLISAALVFAYGDELESYHIGDAVADLRTSGFPLEERAASARSAAEDERSRAALAELAAYLGLD